MKPLLTADEQPTRSAVLTDLNEFRPLIDQRLDQASRPADGCPDRLNDAIRYALLAPGKRLRPALAMMAAEACGAEPTTALPAAVAVELVHAYSLIHDDLPAMDDDDRRRGRPTVHIQFDEATAILAGDALLAMAFQHLAGEVQDPDLAVEAIGILAAAAGRSALVGGQADDLAAELGGPRTVAQLESIHRRKTGALIAAAIDLGALLASASRNQRDILARFANDLGLAFQVVDDLLDFTADENVLGKRAGKDVQRGKLTYPGLLGVDGARQKAEDCVESARRHLSLIGPAAWRLNGLAKYVLERSH